MDYAWVGRRGERMLARDFHNRCGADYVAKGDIPWCKGCNAVLDPYGLHSPNGVTRFDHPDLAEGADPLDDCVHARRGDGRFKGMEPTDYDHAKGARLRTAFFDVSLAEAYAFCFNAVGHAGMSTNRFSELIARADRRRIWAYAGLDKWIIPAVLLTLADHEGRSRGARRYSFRFSFVVPRGAGHGAVLRRPRECKLLKSFDDGKPFTMSENPLSLAPGTIARIAGNHSCVTPALLRELRAAA